MSLSQNSSLIASLETMPIYFFLESRVYSRVTFKMAALPSFDVCWLPCIIDTIRRDVDGRIRSISWCNSKNSVCKPIRYVRRYRFYEVRPYLVSSMITTTIIRHIILSTTYYIMDLFLSCCMQNGRQFSQYLVLCDALLSQNRQQAETVLHDPRYRYCFTFVELASFVYF